MPRADYNQHMGEGERGAGPGSPRLTIEATTGARVELSWLDAVVVPEAARIDYRTVGRRGDFVVTVGTAELVAVCDLDSGEYVISGQLGGDESAAALMRDLLRRRLQHLHEAPIESRQRFEGRLRSLADMSGGTWFAFETVFDL